MQHLEERSKNIHLPIMRFSSKTHVPLVGTTQELWIICKRGVLRSGYTKQGWKSCLESYIPDLQIMPKANSGSISHFESGVA
jgi:hypothetical protein